MQTRTFCQGIGSGQLLVENPIPPPPESGEGAGSVPPIASGGVSQSCVSEDVRRGCGHFKSKGRAGSIFFSSLGLPPNSRGSRSDDGRHQSTNGRGVEFPRVRRYHPLRAVCNPFKHRVRPEKILASARSGGGGGSRIRRPRSDEIAPSSCRVRRRKESMDVDEYSLPDSWLTRPMAEPLPRVTMPDSCGFGEGALANRSSRFPAPTFAGDPPGFSGYVSI